VLFLGEADDMRRFARLLQRFAQTAEEVRLETCDFCVAADETTITLSTAGALAGMRRVSSRLKAFVWMVEPCQADRFAEMIEELAEPNRKAAPPCSSASRLGRCRSRSHWANTPMTSCVLMAAEREACSVRGWHRKNFHEPGQTYATLCTRIHGPATIDARIDAGEQCWIAATLRDRPP
jgi:hypothetical protein